MQREGDPLRVALVADAVGGMHGVTHTLDEIRERGVPGFEVEVVGTDANVDRRLSAVAEVDIPFYAGLKVGVPSLPAIVEALAEGRYDLVHLCSPGPAGVAAAVIARVMEVPVLGSYHTELAAYAGLRAADPKLEFIAAPRSPPSTGSARSSSARAPRPTRSCAGWASTPSASGAGTAASTSRASRPPARRGACCQASSACSTPAG